MYIYNILLIPWVLFFFLNLFPQSSGKITFNIQAWKTEKPSCVCAVFWKANTSLPCQVTVLDQYWDWANSVYLPAVVLFPDPSCFMASYLNVEAVNVWLNSFDQRSSFILRTGLWHCPVYESRQLGQRKRWYFKHFPHSLPKQVCRNL